MQLTWLGHSCFRLETRPAWQARTASSSGYAVIGFNSEILATGLPEEQAQWDWLGTLAGQAAGRPAGPGVLPQGAVAAGVRAG
jgi:hypothetical protein